ncbi:EP300-interacting inhibitor of differentiation 3-like [Paramacrobiotus metropolitanus]|uniref:EP300-interacting inhibitor of differentiation 3-like n=1 Tax=Paramacrobiotus metropolitanus TaxID=2943436 RepID=UPI00244573A8|nr:EP300-interacting inhibitor of differentiation 3-like [Paramacrobiotus metropolitanus]
MSSRSQRSRGRGETSRVDVTEPTVIAEEDDEEIEDLLHEVTDDIQHGEREVDDMDVDAEEPVGQDRISGQLRSSLATQKKSYRLGQLVGKKGTPSQIVLDARLTSRLNTLTMKPISEIRPTPSIWNAKVFSKRLREILLIRSRSADEEDDEPADDEKLQLDLKRMKLFVDDFASQIAPGLAPNLTVVYGAYSTAPPKPKPTKTTQATQKEKDKEPKEPAQVVKKLKTTEMSASLDPTMERVNKLYEYIQNIYSQNRTQMDVMSILVDRESFPKTVENFFCFSFLLKDNKVRMFLDDHSLPVCTPVETSKPGADDDESMEVVPDPVGDKAADDKFQIIMMDLTESSWKKLVTLIPAPVEG